MMLQVTVLLGGDTPASIDAKQVVASLAKVAQVVQLPHPYESTPPLVATLGQQISFDMMEWLLHVDGVVFDSIMAFDWYGLAYYPLMAKRLANPALASTRFTIIPYMSSMWWHLEHTKVSVFEYQLQSSLSLSLARSDSHLFLAPPDHGGHDEIMQLTPDKEFLNIDYMERQSVAMADVVVAPSQYALQWRSDFGWSLPRATFVVPLPLPLLQTSLSKQIHSQLSDFDANQLTFVYWGALAHDKGLDLFVDAVSMILSVVDDIRFVTDTHTHTHTKRIQ
jgi:glycosyltransferase involved in cell wall biosynthesis